MDETVKTSLHRHVCPSCGRVFNLKASLKAHLSKHCQGKETTTARTYPDQQSSTPFSSVDSCYESDFLVAATSFASLIVSQSADTTSHESLHIERVDSPNVLQPVTESNLQRVRWRCDECQKSFDDPGKLDQHQSAKQHKGISKDDETSGYESEQTVKATNVPANTQFHCALCSKSFDMESKFLQHNASTGHRQKKKAPKQVKKEITESNKQTELFECDVEGCTRSFDSEVKLLQHKGMKHGMSKNVAESVSSLDDNTEYHCPFDNCDKSFASKGRLLQHEKDKHSEVIGNNPLGYRKLCPHCDEFNKVTSTKPFVFLTYVAKHILTEHSKPGYIKGTCPVCSQRLDKQKNVLTHMARAHLFKQFQDEACFICLRLCKDRDDLQQHTASVHRFKCIMDSCLSMFPSKQLRDKHMLDKHQVYVCGYENCNSIFSSLEEKISHMKSPHKGNVQDTTVLSYLPGLANNHDDGIFSEPIVPRAPSSIDYKLSPFSRNSADESISRQSGAPALDSFIAFHGRFRDNISDLVVFIQSNSTHLGQSTNPENSIKTFKACEELKSLLERVQRRLTPRVD